MTIDSRKNGRFSPHRAPCLRSPLFWGLLLFAVLAAPLRSTGMEKVMLYFYSAEANINNYKTLKAAFDGYLSRFGAYEFQPFGDPRSFEQRIGREDHCLLLLSAWHYRKLSRVHPLTPVLMATRDGRSHQKRILVSASKRRPGDGPIASAGNLAHSRSTLETMFPDQAAADFNILMVPKEIDALMCLGFESATHALVTESALETLKTLDPVLSKRIQVLGETEGSLLPVLAAPRQAAADLDEIIRIVRKMDTAPEGTDILKLLDLDGWRPLTPSDQSKLEG